MKFEKKKNKACVGGQLISYGENETGDFIQKL